MYKLSKFTLCFQSEKGKQITNLKPWKIITVEEQGQKMAAVIGLRCYKKITNEGCCVCV